MISTEWEVRERRTIDGESYLVISIPTERDIYRIIEFTTDESALANLIAAAPALLAVAKETLDYLTPRTAADRVLERLTEAIARAEGRML